VTPSEKILRDALKAVISKLENSYEDEAQVDCIHIMKDAIRQFDEIQYDRKWLVFKKKVKSITKEVIKGIDEIKDGPSEEDREQLLKIEYGMRGINGWNQDGIKWLTSKLKQEWGME